MKKIIYVLLFGFLFVGCEYGNIPNSPFIVKKTESCEGCAGKYKYKINSISNPKRYTQIISDKLFVVGDTLKICN